MIGPHPQYPPMPLIVGAPRSGTTLLRLILDSHSHLSIPPETGFLALGFGRADDIRRAFFDKVVNFPTEAPAWGDFQIPADEFWRELCAIEPFRIGEGFRAFYRLYCQRHAKRQWGDKTPGHILGMPTIEKRLPEAHFIHLIRDGRDVALSWRQQWFAPSQSLDELAGHWKHWVTTGRVSGALCRHYLEVRYEQLVSEPRRVVSHICDFIGLEFQSEMLESHLRAAERLREHGGRLGLTGDVVVTRSQRMRQQAATTEPIGCERAFGWKTRLTAAERKSFSQIAGELLGDLGYEL